MVYKDFSQDKAEQFSKINQTSFGVPETVMVQMAKNNTDDSFIEKMTTFFTRNKVGPFERLKNSIATQTGINPDTVSSLRELGLKTSFMGLRSVWEDTFPRVGRAISLKQQGVSDPWKKADVSPFGVWKAEREKGNVIDFGTAIFGDTNPEDTQEYKDLIDKGYSTEKARAKVLKNKGKNIWTLIEEESKKVDLPESTARALAARGKGTQATFGRVMWQPLHFIVGPEDEAYDFWTGTVDLAANIFDPTFIVGKAVKTVKAGTKMLALSDDAAASVGLLNGFVRKSFSKRTVEQVIDSKDGDKIAEFLLNNRNNPATILEKSNFKFVNKYIMRDQQLADKTTKFMLDLQTIEETGDAGLKAVKELLKNNTNVVASATEGIVPKLQKNGKLTQYFGEYFETYFGPQYNIKLRASNPDQLLVNYSKFLKQLDPTGKIVDRNKRLSDLIGELDALGTKDPFLKGNIIINSVVKDMGSLRQVITKNFEDTGKLNDRSEKLIKKVFTNLGKYIEEVPDQVGKNKRVYTQLGNLPNELKSQWARELSDRGWSSEEITKGFDTFANQPIIESVLTRDLTLPQPSEVIKLVNSLDKSMKGNFLRMADIIGEKGIDNAMNFYVGKVFKPIALLRPAWTVRVIAEEQLRVIADGVLGIRDNYLSPMNILGRMGLIDVRPSAARSGWLNNGVFEAGIGEAESRAFNNLTGRLDRLGIEFETVQRVGGSGTATQANTSKWNQGQFRVINNYLDSRLTKKIAEIKMLGPDNAVSQLKKSKATEQLIDDLLEEGNELREAMLAISTSTNKENIWQVLTDTTDRNLIRQFLNTLDDAITADLSKSGDLTAEMWELLATGKFKNADGKVIDIKQITRGSATKAEIELFNANQLDSKRTRQIAKTNADNQKKAIDEYIAKFGDGLTEDVGFRTVPMELKSPGIGQKITELGMEWLMTRPTNNMSRIPVFKSTYWNKSAELISISSEAVKQKILNGAKKAGINEKQIKKWDKLYTSAGEKGIDDAELIEIFAKGAAVQKTKDLLYDITESRRFWDVARWIFPFGNAYQEVLTTWLGLLGANPGIASRGATIWNGATQPTDTLEDTGKGFFYENPTNGSVVFNYPGTGIVQDWMFGDSENPLDVNVNLPVYAQSLNIAATILPGFGPVIRLPAAFLFRNYPEDSFANEIIFGDFPAPNIKEPGDIARAAGVVPAWIDKFYKVAFNKEENSQGIFGNTVMDTYEALLYAGLIDDSNEDGFKQGMDLAVDKAKGLFYIRAVSQMLGPSGVATPIYEITPENSRMFFLETLADEYRSIKASNNYDDTQALKVFTDRYGFNPLALTVSKTISIEKFPTTEEGYKWYQQNREIYEDYPYVAWYLDPPPEYAEFSFTAYREGLFEGKREYRTPEQWAIAKNKLLGAVALDKFERDLGIVGDNTEPARYVRNRYKKELMDKYWGYGQPNIVGSPNKPTIDMQITQLEKMVKDPELQNNKQVITINKYLKQRQMVIDLLVDQGESETAWKQSNKYIAVRQILRKYADNLIDENPDFGPIFDQLLAKELQPEYEDDLLLQLNQGNNR
tara:strand:- start:3418 stop:8094 length:4677 start_codon:yes stop_codon:yes gene_type:complete